MRHSHRLEKKQYSSIKDYIKDYNNKLKSLGDLKNIMFSKHGYDYNLSNISLCKGKWTSEAVVVERESNSENEIANLIKLLKRNSGNENDFLEIEYDSNDQNYLSFLFYSTAKMKDTF